MIRMDYRKSPPRKPIGGIPLYELDTVYRVCEDLLERDCLPLLHPHLDRFMDQYSSGVLLTATDRVIEIEVVGKGFDAGDLRRGKATPHETLKIDLVDGAVKSRVVVSDAAYERERSAREDTARRLKAYADSVNRSATLSADLSAFSPSRSQFKVELQIPRGYKRIPKAPLGELLEIARTIRSAVIPSLPSSTVYVASLSYLPKHGWVLWDIYGDWYKR